MTSPVSDGRAPEPPAPSPQAAPSPAPPVKKPEPAPPVRPSGAQVLASVLTATTTTFALSYLGVAGTIIGAGLASTFTVLANYWYTRSIIHTQRKVNQIAPKVVRPRTATGGSGSAARASASTQAPADTQVIAAVTDTQTMPTVPTETAEAADATRTAQAAPTASEVSNADEPGRGESLMAATRAGKRRFLIPIVLLFVLLLAVVTAVELGLGKPLSDALRGQEGTGTSVFHNSGPRTPVQDEPGVEPNKERQISPDQSGEVTEGSTTEPDDAEPSEPATTSPAAPETTEPAAPEEPSAKPAEPTEPVEPAGPEAQGPDNAEGQTPGGAETGSPTTAPTDKPGGSSSGSSGGGGSEGADKTSTPAPKDPAVFSVATNG